MPASIVDPYVNIAERFGEGQPRRCESQCRQHCHGVQRASALPRSKIDTSALQLASATEIEDAREKFGALSEAIVAYVDGLHLTLPEGVRVASCPMIHKPLAPAGIRHREPVLRVVDAHVRRFQVKLSFSKHTLANGLDVLLHEDHTCPIVAVNLWYHVGSKNETPGHTGFAHLFEHLMFEGSQHYDKGYFQPLQGAGAALNGSTNADRTNYWEVVPSEALDLALWMESDRMGFLLPALTEAKFSNQRDVVLNERRQNYENRPYGLAPMAMLAALFPPDHPYHWTTIGEIDDLHAARIEDVRRVLQRVLPPGERVAGAGGRHRSGRSAGARARVFRGAAGRSAGRRRHAGGTAPCPSDQRLLLEDRVELPRLYIAWLSPAMFAEGDAELDLAADILANGKTSRLYRRLVFEERMATDVSASQNSREIAGFLQLAATAAPGHALAELEQVILEEIARLAAEGPTPEEIERGRVQAEAQFMFRLQTVGGFGGKSDQLNAYNTFVGDPAFFERDLARYQTVTPRSLQTVVRRYLATGAASRSASCRGAVPDLAIPGSTPAVVS